MVAARRGEMLGADETKSDLTTLYGSQTVRCVMGRVMPIWWCFLPVFLVLMICPCCGCSVLIRWPGMQMERPLIALNLVLALSLIPGRALGAGSMGVKCEVLCLFLMG